MVRKKEQARRKQKFQLGFGWVKPVLAVLTVAGSALGLTLMLDWMNNPHQWPVKKVRIEGEFRHLQNALLHQAVAPMTAAGFFVMNVRDIQTALQSLAWVDKASVRRVWPDQLHIGVVEQRAVAYWGEDGFMNARAEVFKPEQAVVLSGVPRLSGPDGYAQRVLNMHIKMQALLKPLRLGVVQLTLDARRAWQLELTNGLTLAVGRNHPLQRVARFVSVYPTVLAAGKGQLLSVDLRYSNGFAAHWESAEKSAGNTG